MTLSTDEQTLLDAARDGDLATVKRMVHRKVDVNVQDECGCTPLHGAVRWKHTSVVQFLLENGANPNAKAKMLKLIRGDTPLFLATAVEAQEYVDIVPLLVRAGADLNSPDADDNLPLHLLVKEGIIELVECLLDHGANVNARNSLGNTPLHVACHSGTWCTPEVIDVLFRKGATADSKMLDELIGLALEKAESNNRDAIVERLRTYKTRAQSRSGVDKIRLQCPQCLAQLSAPQAVFGKRVKCPQCSNVISVPASPQQLLLSKHFTDINSSDFKIRNRGVRAIGLLAREGKDVTKAIPSLMNLAMHDPNAYVRSYALNAINPMLQKRYPYRPTFDHKFIIQMATCLISEHSDADDVNKELIPGVGTALKEIRNSAAANLIAIGSDSLDAITACVQHNPEGAKSAQSGLFWV